MTSPIPILLYHTVSDDPPPWIAPFAVKPVVFRRHLDEIVGSGLAAITISDLVDGLDGARVLPERPVVVTFDDGFRDLLTTAGPALAERNLPATAYLTTGALAESTAPTRLPPAAMIGWTEIGDVEAMGVEVGGHTHSHPPLDIIPEEEVARELLVSKMWLQEFVGHPIRSFAYPHGFYSPTVQDHVRRAGYDSAAAVRNALSSALDDRYALCRLTVRADTGLTRFQGWLSGRGAPVSPAHVRLRTRAFRAYRGLRERAVSEVAASP